MKLLAEIRLIAYLCRNLNNKTGGQMKGSQKMQGRVLYRAYEENQGKAQDGVLRAIEQARDRFNKRSKVVN
jgi:hypothetical protein